MITTEELDVLPYCVEGFLYGKILCHLTCTLLKKVQLFPNLGIYSAIFIIFLHYVLSKESRTMGIVFYALCTLYILATAAVVSDLLEYIIEVSNNSICTYIIFLSVMQWHTSTLPVQLQSDSQSMLFHIIIVQGTVNGCCDFIAQCTLVRINHYTYQLFYSLKFSQIYRCWIVWGKNIWVVIAPSFLAITYIGQSIYLHLISRFQFIASSCLASVRRRNNICKWRNFKCSLGGHAGPNKFDHIHGRECPGDGLDRVQDPQGVLGG